MTHTMKQRIFNNSDMKIVPLKVTKSSEVGVVEVNEVGALIGWTCPESNEFYAMVPELLVEMMLAYREYILMNEEAVKN